MMASSTEETPGRRHRRVRMLVAYDGAAYHGFARNDPYPTVAGELELHLATVLGEDVQLTCSGRTDRGVHARGQVVTFDTTSERVDVARMKKSLNRLTSGALAIRSVELVDDAFDARYSARWRRYQYRVLRTDWLDPARAASVWWVPGDLDLDAMRQAAVPLVGVHDFSAFCRKVKPVANARTLPTMVRHVHDVQWWEAPDDEWWLEIRAKAFCHQMVRSITGLLIDVGRGKRTAADVAAIVRSGDRSMVATVAPPHGLTLWDVGFDDGVPVPFSGLRRA